MASDSAQSLPKEASVNLTPDKQIQAVTAFLKESSNQVVDVREVTDILKGQPQSHTLQLAQMNQSAALFGATPGDGSAHHQNSS